MKGFKNFILKESTITDDIATLCKSILDSNDPEIEKLNLHLIYEMIQDVNPRKVKFIQDVFQSNNKRLKDLLLVNGAEGFIQPTRSNGWHDFINYNENPMLKALVDIDGVPKQVVVGVEFNDQVCTEAGNKQMGLAEHLGRNVTSDHLNLDKIVLLEQMITSNYYYKEPDDKFYEDVKEQLISNPMHWHAANTKDHKHYVVIKDFENPDYDKIII